MNKSGRSLEGRPYRTFDKLNVHDDRFEVWVGGQKPNECPEVEWVFVPGEFQFHEGCDVEQCAVEGSSSQVK